MAAQAMYRRWRSQTFEEIIGQDHVVQTLRNALRDGRVAHAYLFCGPRGTGKTSTARILAKAVNCTGESDEKPCNECHLCKVTTEGRSLDLIEIDAASNRGIDEIRDLREKVNFAPTEGRFKVYVIDEVHMLTREAFNALLKTLEEPPPHVIFILCTTEPHRIPATVLSRCQRHDFRRVSLKNLIKKLKLICEKEEISITAEALELIARQATGSFRDAESLLDQLASYGGESEITLGQVQAMLGTASRGVVSDLVGHLIARDTKAGLHLINDVIYEGTEPRQFNAEVLEHLHDLLLLKTSGGSDLINVTTDELAAMKRQAEEFDLSQLIRTIRLFNGVASSLRHAPQPQMPLELAFVEATLPVQEAARETSPNPASSPGRTGKPSPRSRERRRSSSPQPRETTGQAPAARVAESRPAEPAKRARVSSDEEGRSALAKSEAADPHQDETVPAPGSTPLGEISGDWLRENWSRLLSEVRPYNRMAEALLRSCRPVRVDGNVVVVGVRHPFHKGKIEDPRNKEVVEKVLMQLTGTPCRLSCVVQSSETQANQNRQKKRKAILDDPVVQAARNMGGKVVDVRLDVSGDSG